ncbi:MAG: serine/threonine protein kinase, partial [Steroidobacteraceae bacterium]|nr:serine/threonine protein kinase [Steroidobacteraceae bacterium]
MDTTRWQHLESLFHELAELPPGSVREAALAARCGDDAALAAEVRALLDNDAPFDGADGVTDPHLGLRLGAYEVTALIARGGMAAVYDARRADETFEQRVAIKVMDLRLSDPALVAQFRAERQILAALEHPSLTRLLDGGVTPLGEPYLVMEYVEGQPIDRYCDSRHLDVPARLKLFAEVCDGVAFAHRSLVLHRDLKPSNVLVTAEGRVKIVDFGTATLLQPDRLATMSPAPLTPAYASPEQLTGGAVGTASDQYSLGLVLFELLTGASAFGERTSLMAAMERALAATTTTAPHAAVTEAAAAARQTSLAKLRRTLAGDLATILGKALAHAPAARYASVQHLADDLGRWAAGEPIQGRAPTLAYQASRFVRRHWVSTSIAATLAVALIAAAVVSVQQAARAREQAMLASQQAQIAQTESQKARQLNRFLTQMLSSANPSWYNPKGGSAASITVREVLDGAGALIPAELGGAPDVEAEMRRTLGRTYIGMADPARALPHLQRALELYEASSDRFGEAFTQALLGEARVLMGDYVTAEGYLRSALAYVRSLNGEPTDPDLHMMATNDLAIAINGREMGSAEGLALKREAIDVADRSPATAGPSALGRSNLSVDYMNLGRLDEALDLLRDAERRMAALPADWPERGYVFNNLSLVLRLRGDYPEAEAYGAKATDAAAQVWGRTNARWAGMTVNWARSLVATGQAARGLKALREAYAEFRKVRSADHPDLLGALVGLGVAHRALGQLGNSERMLRQARAIARAARVSNDRSADVAGELGLTLRARGARAEAAALLAEAHA